MNPYDVIIIGSGAGGLTSGAFLSKQGYRVLILEQHSVPGGYLHGFKRKGFFFNSAVYSIAGCGPDGYVKYLLDKLEIGQDLVFKEYEAIYRAMIGSDSYILPVGFKKFQEKLTSDFPDEKESIPLMMAEMDWLYQSLELEKFGKPASAETMMKIIQKWGKKSYKEFIDSFIKNERLRSILYSLWLFCAMPESQTSALYGVLMLMIHIVESSHYIQGGCDQLAEKLADSIITRGGEIRYKSRVKNILIRDGKAAGVRLENGTELFSKAVIAACDARSVLISLIDDPQAVSNLVRRRIEKLSPSISTFALYIAAEINPEIPSPFKDANQIFYLEGTDNEEIYKGSLSRDYKPFRSLLITEIPDDSGTAGVKTFNVYSLMSFNRNENWKEVKPAMTDFCLKQVEKVLGNYLKKIIVLEAGSPSTFYRYTLNDQGAMYGFENTADPYKGAKLENKTGVPNLFLAGHWTKPGGSVYNAMTSGMEAVKLINEYFQNNH